MYNNDVAIIMLNFYPKEMLGRALDSICSQTWDGSWTLYIGFHNRDLKHKNSIQRLCDGLPVHFVDIEQDMVMDPRPRNIILQEALRIGNHRWLFFLDDDDEWYPSYLECMISQNVPFMTCGKDVMIDETGVVETRLNDIDYTGMGFRFEDWKGRSLPYFVKQVSDKHICRTFKSKYSNAPHISEPLYLIHQHRDSLTFWGSLGRNSYKDKILSGLCRVVYDDETDSSQLRRKDCDALAKTLNGQLITLDEAMFEEISSAIYIMSINSLLKIFRLNSSKLDKFFSEDNFLLAFADETPEIFLARSTKDIMNIKRVDGVLLADPMWIEEYEKIHPTCLPVGVPSLITEETVLENLKRHNDCNFSNSKRKKLHVFGKTSFSEEVIQQLPTEIELSSHMGDADLCWLPQDTDKSWGRSILEAYETGIPCISSSDKTVIKILFDGTELISNDDNAKEMAKRIVKNMKNNFEIENAIPFFRRCFNNFYWTNSFNAYMLRLLEQKKNNE